MEGNYHWMPRSIISYYKKAIINLVSSVQDYYRKADENLQLCKNIQITLIEKIIYIEHRIRSLKGELAKAKIDLHKKHEYQLSKEQSALLKDRIKFFEGRIAEYHDLRSAFKSIGDAIAFTHLDEWSIKQFSQKEDVGFISGKAGFILEMQCFQLGFDRGIPTILHDITNSLKHGDISFFLKGGKFISIECKSGNTRGQRRAQRQVNDLREILQFLYTDERVKDGNKVHMVELRYSASRYSRTITELIEDSANKRGGSLNVENGLFYVVSQNQNYLVKEISRITKNKEMYLFYLNGMKFNSIGYFPFSLSIVNPESVYRFFSDETRIVVLIDLEEFFDRLAEKDIGIEDADKDGYIFRVFRKSDNFEIYVSQYFFMRVPFEFLSISWFIDEVSQMLLDPSDEIKSILNMD